MRDCRHLVWPPRLHVHCFRLYERAQKTQLQRQGQRLTGDGAQLQQQGHGLRRIGADGHAMHLVNRKNAPQFPAIWGATQQGPQVTLQKLLERTAAPSGPNI